MLLHFLKLNQLRLMTDAPTLINNNQLKDLGIKTDKEMNYKRPESVLILVYTSQKDVLLLKYDNEKDMWQSITGSLLEMNYPVKAERELFEETGIKTKNLNMFNTYEIYKMWLHKYENGVTHNKEHIFTLELSEKENICINPDEHDEYIWLPRVKAAEKFKTNREAIFNHI